MTEPGLLWALTLAALVVLPVIAIAVTVAFKDETWVRYAMTAVGVGGPLGALQALRENRRARGLRGLPTRWRAKK